MCMCVFVFVGASVGRCEAKVSSIVWVFTVCKSVLPKNNPILLIANLRVRTAPCYTHLFTTEELFLDVPEMTLLVSNSPPAVYKKCHPLWRLGTEKTPLQ